MLLQWRGMYQLLPRNDMSMHAEVRALGQLV